MEPLWSHSGSERRLQASEMAHSQEGLVKQGIEPSLDRLLLDLRTSRGDRRSQQLERPGVTGISLQLRLVPTVQRQALTSERKQLGRHTGRLERHPGPLFEQAGNADAGRVEIEDGVEAQLGLQLRVKLWQRGLAGVAP